MALTIQKLLAAGERVRVALNIRDVAIVPQDKTIYLLGSVQQLTRLVRGHGANDLKYIGCAMREHLKYATISYWDELDYGVLSVMGEMCGTYLEDWHVQPIPTPGGPQKMWWSSKTGMRKPKVTISTLNLCDQQPIVDFGGVHAPILLSGDFYQTRKLPALPLMLTHSLNVGDLKAAITECDKSLLWPSWALGWRVPVGFGEITFFSDIYTLVQGLKPIGTYSRRITLHSGDAWTVDTRELELLAKASTWELRGDRQWWEGSRNRDVGGWGQRGLQDTLINDKRAKSSDDIVGGHVAEHTETVDTITKLQRTIRDRLTTYLTVHTDPYVYVQRDVTKLAEAHWYDYLELKVQGRVSLSKLPLVAYPISNARAVERWLDRGGFVGWRLPLDDHAKHWTHDEHMSGVAWAWTATQGVLQWAADVQAGRVVGRVPEAVRSPYSGGKTFDPIAGISRKYNYAWGGRTNANRPGWIIEGVNTSNGQRAQC